MNCEYSNDSITYGNKRLHLDLYTTGDRQPVILFIPGMGCYAGIYHDFMKELGGLGFTIIGIDLPGHGRSQGPRGRFTFHEVMEAVKDLVTYAGSRFNDRIGLMGTSLGGTFALYAAMHDTRLKAVLCHNAMDISSDLHVPTRFPALIRFTIRYMRFTSRLLPGFPIPLKMLVDWRKVIDDPDLLTRLYNDPCMVWFYTLGTWASFLDYIPETDLRGIETPVKIVVGSKDLLFPPEYCHSLSRKIGKDGASFEMLTGGHALPLEYVPDFAPLAATWFGKDFKIRKETKRSDSYGTHRCPCPPVPRGCS